jgi:hypothetical protein
MKPSAEKPKAACAQHPDSVVTGICHSCGERFCQSCLIAGSEYYYCLKRECQGALKEEVGSKFVCCPHCGAKNRADAANCNACKSVLIVGPDSKHGKGKKKAVLGHQCEGCGHLNDVKACFCGACGRPLQQGRQGLVVAQSYPNVVEAHLARTKLESIGIACDIYDENMVTLNPFFSAIGGGVRLVVWAHDLYKARKALDCTSSGKLWGGFNTP